jgi:hypothetical protein
MSEIMSGLALSPVICANLAAIDARKRSSFGVRLPIPRMVTTPEWMICWEDWISIRPGIENSESGDEYNRKGFVLGWFRFWNRLPSVLFRPRYSTIGPNENDLVITSKEKEQRDDNAFHT